MINLLIPTMPNDTHAIYVHLAIQQKGHNSLLWQTADFPTLQMHSFEFNNKELHWAAHGPNFSIQNQFFDVVWYRRPRPPLLSNKLHQDDRKSSKKENRALFNSFWHIIAPDALWVNSDENAKRANCKMLQLKVAMQLGLMIPKTLMSNDPAKIRKFIIDNGPNNTIYKTFCPLAWQPSPYGHLAYSTVVTPESLSSDELLQSTAGIFQEKITKAFELRVTYFGTHPVAVKLCSQEHPQGQIDWRAIPDQELVIEPYQLPDAIHEKCKALMDVFGLLFGCFDFIVTPANEYYFLEINEQGQFLWIEDVNPDIKMLDIFSEFLIGKNKQFAYKEHKNSILLSDLSTEVAEIKAKAVAEHLYSMVC